MGSLGCWPVVRGERSGSPALDNKNAGQKYTADDGTGSSAAGERGDLLDQPRPMPIRDRWPKVLHGLGAEQRANGAGDRQRLSAEMSVKKTRGPRIAGAGGVDDVLDRDRRDAMQLVAA